MGKDLQERLRVAEGAFEIHEPPVEERETGFEEDRLKDEDVQLRKACRALKIAKELVHDEREGLAHERYYAAAIELSFSCAERTCHGMLISSGRVSPEERPPHQELLARSYEAGIWTAEEAEALEALYDDNRAVYYYRRGIPSRSKAAALLAVAEEVHRLAAESALFGGGTCICVR